MNIGPISFDPSDPFGIIGKDVGRLILERVFGWEVFSSWPSYQQKYGGREYAIGAGQWFTTPTHVAFWAEKGGSSLYRGEWRVFTPDHEDMFTFDPLHNMADAHRILRHIYESGNDTRMIQVAGTLLEQPIEPIDGKLPWLYWMDITSRTWKPEQICKAVYEVVRAEQ